MSNQRLLLVDDDHIILDSLAEFLRQEGYPTDTADGYHEAKRLMESRNYSTLVTDINMPTVSGVELLRYSRETHPDTVVILITGYGTIESAVEAIKMGAYDYVTKPIIDDEIKLIVDRAAQQYDLLVENKSLKAQLDLRFGLENIIGHDYKMLKVFDLIEAVADTKATVLITGESGTGKTLVARAVHHRSSRRNAPFVEVSCGALPETLLESELFGHVRGSFTGAISDKPGKFQQADGGTIFLDEISCASPILQVKLLRVLQDMEFERVGGVETLQVDTRVVLATNRDLAEEVAQGNFRQDLLYRVNVMPIHIPPLRQRIGDIPRLAKHFLETFCLQNNKQIHGFTDEAVQILQRYRWTGNVRELENVVERAVVLCKKDTVTPNELPPHLQTQQETTSSDSNVLPLRQALEDPERRIIERALKSYGWNRQMTADALGINRTTLYKKMKKYGLELDYEALSE